MADTAPIYPNKLPRPRGERPELEAIWARPCHFGHNDIGKEQMRALSVFEHPDEDATN